MAYLEVVVPPEIDDIETSGETEVEEEGNVNLVCKARGYPKPVVSWRREGGAEIVLRDRDTKSGMLILTVFHLLSIINNIIIIIVVIIIIIIIITIIIINIITMMMIMMIMMIFISLLLL